MIRKVLISAFALFALLAASAQAHTATFTASCGTASINWTAFASSGSGNGGHNTPTWSVSFTPTGGSKATYSASSATYTPVVSFTGSSDTLTLPSAAIDNGTVTFATSWTAAQTRDSNANSYTGTVVLSGCAKSSPAIATKASAAVNVGGSVTDTATLSGGQTPTGTITWKLYGPNDASCLAANPPSVVQTATGDGTYTSPTLPVNTAGTYYWIASYNGDVNNNGVSGKCGDANETVTVNKVNPAISTQASPAVAVNGMVTDTATLAGGDKPSGQITWKLYGPNDASCLAANPPSVVQTATGDGTYTSPALPVNTAGTYYWVASYIGDANNNAVSGKCGDANETVTVGQVGPTLTTSASPASATIGAAITDVAHLGGGDSPTGTISWKLYGPNDNSCTSTAPLSTTAVTVNGDGDYTSPALTPTAAGTYHWVASYSGDANNTAIGPVGCTDASETVVLNPPPSPPVTPPAVVVTPSPVAPQVPASGVKACVASKATIRRLQKAGSVFEAVVRGAKITKVTFLLDGKKYKTLTRPDAKDGVYEIRVTPTTTSFGSHTLTAKVTEQCGANAASLHFSHPAPRKEVQPKFTG